MLRNQKLYDPIERTANMTKEEFTTYVDINKSHNGTTDTSLIDKIKHNFYTSHPDADLVFLDDAWDIIFPKLLRNPGLAQFTLDYHGDESEYFFPWLSAVFKSPSEALEMAYGAGSDLVGVWDTEILDTNDYIVPFIRNDPTFVYNRERQLYVADLVTTMQARGRSKVVDFGAGRLAWSRWHGFEFEPWHQEIYAFDSDPSIRPDTLFTESLDSLGIHFKHGDLTAQLVNPDCRDADLVILGGVASYVPLDIFSQKIVPAVWNLLKDDGVFFFDYQIGCPYLRRSMSIFSWPDMYLFDDVPSAVAVVETIRKNLWTKGLKFSAEYAVDTYNEYPSSVMITLQKI